MNMGNALFTMCNMGSTTTHAPVSAITMELYGACALWPRVSSLFAFIKDHVTA